MGDLAVGRHPIGVQANPDDALLDYTMEVFQPHSAQRLTRADAREIVEDVSGFLSLLAEWDREARTAEAEAKSSPLRSEAG